MKLPGCQANAGGSRGHLEGLAGEEIVPGTRMLEARIDAAFGGAKVADNRHIHICVADVDFAQLSAGGPGEVAAFKHMAVCIYQFDNGRLCFVQLHAVLIIVVVYTILISPWQWLIACSAIVVDGNIIAELAKLP